MRSSEREGGAPLGFLVTSVGESLRRAGEMRRGQPVQNRIRGAIRGDRSGSGLAFCLRGKARPDHMPCPEPMP